MTDMGFHLINGIWAQWWWLVDQWPTVIMGGIGIWHWLSCRRIHHRAWLLTFMVAILAGAAYSRSPTPYIMLFVALCVLLAVQMDKSNPDTLRFRTVGGLALYGLAGLGGEVAFWGLTRMDVNAYTEAVAAYGDAQVMVGGARRGLYTMITWGLWLIVPLGILSMVLQGMITHPPLRMPLAHLVDMVRSWGYGGDRIHPNTVKEQAPPPHAIKQVLGPRIQGQGQVPETGGTRRPPRPSGYQ